MTQDERAAIKKLTDWRSGITQGECVLIAALIERQSKVQELDEIIRPPWQNPKFTFAAGLAIGGLVMWLVTGAL